MAAINADPGKYNGNRALGVRTDVASRESVKAMLAEAAREFGGNDKGGGDLKVAAAVFNVSGKFVRAPFLELKEQDWDLGMEGSVYVSFPCSSSTRCTTSPLSLPLSNRENSRNGGQPLSLSLMTLLRY